jgi:hypothetical protein
MLLGNSTDVHIGTRAMLLYDVRRPPCARQFRNEGELADIPDTVLDLELLRSLDPEYLSPLEILMDRSAFERRLVGPLPTRHRVSRFMKKHLHKILSMKLGRETRKEPKTIMPLFTVPKRTRNCGSYKIAEG